MQTEVIQPLDHHIYFVKTKSCMYCHQPLRCSLHAFNHWKKYHNKSVVTMNEQPDYFVWFEGDWVKVNMETCMAAMLEKRAYAITKPKTTNTSRSN